MGANVPYSVFVQLLNKNQRTGSGPAAGAGGGLAGIRGAVTAFFAIDGFIFASWAVRIPAVKEQTAASPAVLGLALLGASGGAVATMMISGALCRRFGSRQMTVAGASWLSLALLLPPLAHSALWLGLALVVFGIGYGCLNVAMNSVAVDLVGALGRPVMPSFHAAWSFGGLAGAALGGLLAPHLSPLPHLALIATAGIVITVACGRMLLARPVPPVAGASGASGSARAGSGAGLAWRGHVWRVVVLFGLIALCGGYGEGAIGDWGALHLKQDLGAGPGMAAFGYAAFALAEACGRLAGSWLLARFGQRLVLVGGGLVASAGMLAAALAPAVAVALIGFALTGLGVANLFPAAMSRAGLLAGPSGVAAASALGYAGFLLGPPTIGFLASSVSLRIGLTTVSFLALIAAALGYFASERTRSGSERGWAPRRSQYPPPGRPLREHVDREADFRVGQAQVLGAAVGHREQPADPAGDRVLGERRVGELAEFLQGRLAVGDPQPAGQHEVLRRVGAEDLQGAFHPRAGCHRRARRAAQVRVVEVRQPVGGRPDLAAHPPLLEGQHRVVRAQPGQHGADTLAVADHHPIHAAGIAGLGGDLQPPGGTDEGQRRFRAGTGDLERHRAARLGQRPVHEERAAPGGLAVADAP
jgi:MFS family permease